MTEAVLLWVVMGLVLCAYVLTGGADLGGGIWTLLARGPSARAQRRAVDRAIAPIWEANHVWLIVLIVLMFTAFPAAFSAIGIALHIPISLALVGLVLRGSAFVFQAYGLGTDDQRRRWQGVFAWSSALTPLCLGSVLAAVASGAIRVEDGVVRTGFFAGWLSWFALATGLLAAATFALTAAVYLTVDAENAVRTAFYGRALRTQAVVAVLALAAGLAARRHAPQFAAALFASRWSPWIVAGAIGSSLAVAWALRRRAGHVARVAVAAEVACLVLGWGIGMDGHLLRPDLPAAEAGPRAPTIRALGPILAAGTVVLAPSLWYLLRVFKGSDRA